MNLKRLLLLLLVPAAIIFLPSKALATSPTGAFDAATVSQFAGWACDPDKFDQPLDIHFYADGVAGGGGWFVQSANANQIRSDLTGACGGYTNHGYSFTPPASLNDGNDHMIYMYALGIRADGTTDGDNPYLAKMMYRGGSLIYPNPAPDSRTMRTPWVNVNESGCAIGCDNDHDEVNILVDNVKYKGTATCGWHGECQWRADDDSTCELGCARSSYAGQLLNIPSTIGSITAIYFDNVWIGQEGGPQVGMNSEIRVYRGTNRNNLIGSVRANVPWTGGTPANTKAIFNPPISINPGEQIYFELYSLDDLDTRWDGVNPNPGLVLLVPLADLTNNNSKDSYSAGYAYYHPDIRYQLSPRTNEDLANVRVYGTTAAPVTLSGRVTNCTTNAGIPGVVINQGYETNPGPPACLIGTQTTDANGNFSFTNIPYAQGFCIRGPTAGVSGYTGPDKTYECQKAGYYASPDGCGANPGQDMSVDNDYDICYTPVATPSPSPTPAPPTITSLQVNNINPPPAFSSGIKATGLQSSQEGSNWYNPMLITLNANQGSVPLRSYYIAFYNRNVGSAYTSMIDASGNPISQLQTLLNNDRREGFILRYDASGRYYVWNPSITNWFEITGDLSGKAICGPADCTTQIYYTAYPGDSLSTPRNENAARTWTVLIDRNFQSKTFYTAVYVVDNNNLSAFTANYPNP